MPDTANDAFGGKFGVIVDVHGDGFNAEGHEAASNIGRYGTADGYIVIQPTEGVDAYWMTDSDGEYNWQDIGKMEAFLKKIITKFSVIDSNRVHVSGFSAGAIVAFELLCRASDVICSIAPTGFNALGEWDRGPHAGLKANFGDHKNCWLDGSGPLNHRSIFYGQGKYDVTSSPTMFKKSIDAFKTAYGISGDGTSVSGKGDGVEWTEYTSGSVKVDTALFDYKGAYAGHCVPSSMEDGAPTSWANCGGPGAYTWGKEAVEFFKQNPCSMSS